MVRALSRPRGGEAQRRCIFFGLTSFPRRSRKFVSIRRRLFAVRTKDVRDVGYGRGEESGF
jgi:hypothetical protein